MNKQKKQERHEELMNTDELSAFIESYSSKNGSKGNRLLTDRIGIAIDGSADSKLSNNHTIVLGAPGSGKGYHYVVPNLLQSNSAYVVVDMGGNTKAEYGPALKKAGYEIKCVNLSEPAEGDRYNLFRNISRENADADIDEIAAALTQNPVKKNDDLFFKRCETQLLCALIEYVYHKEPAEKQSLRRVVELLDTFNFGEEGSAEKAPLDTLFENYEAEDPGALAVRNYNVFSMGGGKTRLTVAYSLRQRLDVYARESAEQFSGTDTIDLQTLGRNPKYALFVNIPVIENELSNLSTVLLLQAFSAAVKNRNTKGCTSGVVSVHFVLDEFGSVPAIPHLPSILAVGRCSGFTCSMTVQSLEQIRTTYGDEANLIINRTPLLFLGSVIPEDIEYLLSISDYVSARSLTHMPLDECILFIPGKHPIWDKKLNPKKFK